MDNKELFILLNLLLLLGAFSGPVLGVLRGSPRSSSYVPIAFTILAAVCGLFLSLNILSAGGRSSTTALSLKAPNLIPWINFSFFLDGLAAFFLLIISLMALATSVYSIGYNKEFYKRNVGVLGLCMNLFILSMIGVVSADNALVFLIFWEMMTLASYFLVVYEYEKVESVRAGLIYIVMAHAGTAFIVAAFLFLYKWYGSFDFAVLRASVANLPGGPKDLLFVLFLLGFGVKAGIVPLHIWLPKAHPAAPSSASALMSGVMIKVAIYGLVRMVIDILGGGSPWWGVAVLVIASASAVLGVLYALVEHDLKRLLAYHSVENIGIILMGIGASMVFSSMGESGPARVALVAGLFHTLNHSIFKGLLFLGAGSVVFGTHIRNLEELGGLIKRMPWTALCFLVGAVSISGLPPFNGFVSEWLTFQGLLMGFGVTEGGMRVFLPVVAIILGFSSALAASCFVKAFGMTFLALPRSEHARHAVESPLSMRLSMGMLAGLCLLLGVMPQYVLGLVDGVASTVLYTRAPFGNSYDWFTLIPLTPGGASALSGFSPQWVFLLLLAFTGGLLLVMGIPYRRAILGETWGCGIPALVPRMEYTATAFSKPFMIIFRDLYRTTEDMEKIASPSPLQPHFTRIRSYEVSVVRIFERYFYEPLVQVVMAISNKMQILQSGSIHLYLLYFFIALIVLIFWIK
ncbi:MAG TPA: hydrogenase 4 subunit B [Candidatus Brocadiales bacterium]|nr:hydrogenase 4 subunit B [Candidatus Brocadiales bacterium]